MVWEVEEGVQIPLFRTPRALCAEGFPGHQLPVCVPSHAAPSSLESCLQEGMKGNVMI